MLLNWKAFLFRPLLMANSLSAFINLNTFTVMFKVFVDKPLDVVRHQMLLRLKQFPLMFL